MSEKALRLFREACGLTAQLSLQFNDPSRPAAPSTTRSFDLPFVLVGRDPNADLVLDHAEVSKHHVLLQAIAGRILVTDLQSRNKVYWEGDETARSQGWLDHGQFIQVGPFQIRRSGPDSSEIQHRMLPAPSAPSDQERVEAGTGSRAALELPFRTGGVPSLWPVDGPVAIVGRSDNCQLVLTDESISRYHAALVTTPCGLWVVDLLAREGVYVNNECMRWAWLADGDTLRLGRFTFILRYDTILKELAREDVPLEAGATVPPKPGTELAVPMRQRQIERSSGAARPEGRSTLGLKPENSHSAAEPARLVPSIGEEWQPSMPFPPNPMAIWQQQMQLMESFHNDMIMMVQMFVAMHKEHSASVRQELEKVQQLTRELSALQAKAAKSPELGNAGETAGVDRPSRQGGPAKAAGRKKPDRDVGVEQPDRVAPRTKPNSTEAAGRSRASGSKIAAVNGTEPRTSDEARQGDASEFHAGLTERIAQLQRERQGYWQTILKAINR